MAATRLAMASPHDSIFRQVFGQPVHAAGLLRSALPHEAARRIEWAKLKRLQAESVSDELSERRADLIFETHIGGRRALLYLLLEHQSTSSPLMAFRLLAYMVRLWEDHVRRHPRAKRLPAILPVVVHHSPRGWRAALCFEELLDLDADALRALRPIVPSFRYLLDDLSAARSEDVRGRVLTALGKLTCLAMSRARVEPDLLPLLAECHDLLIEAADADSGVAALAGLIRYILSISQTDPDAAVELCKQLGPKLEEAAMTGAEILRRRGFAQGEAEGRVKGGAELLLRQLEVKFGPLDEARRARILALSSDAIDRCAERVLTAETFDEVVGSD